MNNLLISVEVLRNVSDMSYHPPVLIILTEKRKSPFEVFSYLNRPDNDISHCSLQFVFLQDSIAVLFVKHIFMEKLYNILS